MDKNLRIQVILNAVGDKAVRALSALRGGARETAKELKATRDRLKALDAAQRDLATFRALKADMRGAGAATAEVQKRIADLAAKMRAAEGPTRKLNAEMRRAKSDALALKQAHIEKNRQLEELRRRLGAAGVATSDMAKHEARLRGEIARTSAELDVQKRKLAEVAKREEQTRRSRASIGRMQAFQSQTAIAGATSTAAGVAIGAPMLAQVDQLMQVESSMTSIGQKADLSRRQTAALLKELRATSPVVNQELGSLVEGVDALTGFGLGPKIATDMMKPIGMAATAYKAEIADLSAAAFAAGDNLKVPWEQTGLVIDIMAKAGKLGAVEIKDMAAGFPALTAQAQALGQTGAPAVAELAAALQIVRKGAGDSATAITNLQNLQQKILSPETIRKFAKAGIDLQAAMKAAAKAGKSPLEAIAEITSKATKGDLSKLGFFFEDAQAQAALRSLMQNMDEFRSIREQAMAAGGTTERDFAERMKDGAEASKAMKLEVKALALDFANDLLPAVVAGTRLIREVAGGVRNWAKAHPGLAKALAVTLAALAGLLVAFGALNLITSAVLGPFITMRLAFLTLAPILGPMVAGLWGMVSALGGMAVALLANPITWIILAVVAAVALLAGGVYLIVKHWGAIVTWFKNLWQSIKSTTAEAIAGLVMAIVNSGPLGAFIRAFAPVFLFFVQLGARFYEIGRAIIQGLIAGVGAMLGALIKTITDVGGAVWGAFKKKLGIASPSRVFAELGRYTMAGLQVGLERGQDGPLASMRSTAARLTAAMAIGAASPAAAGLPSPGMGPGAGGGSGGGDHFEVHFHAAPGMDEQALLKLFEDWMRRRDERRRAASFNDHGE